MPVANEVIPADFFLRNGIDRSEDIGVCFKVIRDRYPGCGMQLLETQGGCSYTVVVVGGRRRGTEEEDGEDVVVQFRLLEHAVKKDLMLDVRRVFGMLVPKILWVEEVRLDERVMLQVCGMTRVKGIGFGGVQPRHRTLSGLDYRRLASLVEGMAAFFAMSWQNARQSDRMKAKGKVGSSIRQRLLKLEKDLPATWLRLKATRTKEAFDAGLLDPLPMVLNHGDLLPSNIMVDGTSWRLTGLVDWAEVEHLPFGMSLYGIEHLLGFLDIERKIFVYYDQAHELRDVFWRRLRIHIPELIDPTVRQAVLLSRDVGILLWHGIAWDEGRLDRVVNFQDDKEELAYLQNFLEGPRGGDKPFKL